MSKIRVYNLAKMFEMSNTEMVDLLTEIGVSIKSHMSSIDEEVSLQVEEELKKKRRGRKKVVEAIRHIRWSRSKKAPRYRMSPPVSVKSPEARSRY